jgi:hypothetical protein
MQHTCHVSVQHAYACSIMSANRSHAAPVTLIYLVLSSIG